MAIQVVIVTPEETALDVSADFVVLPLFDGEMGVLPGHAPTIGRLGFGEMRVRDGGATNRFYIDGGFAQVADDVVTVLTGQAIDSANLNAQDIRQSLDEAERSNPESADEKALKTRAIAQAKAQLKVAEA